MYDEIHVYLQLEEISSFLKHLKRCIKNMQQIFTEFAVLNI